MTQIVLGSSSPFRKALLSRILDQFETCSPDIDESPLPDEPPQQLVQRLSQEKARAVAVHYPDALIIASDQVSVLNGRINGKPGNFDNAMAQLKASSGQTVTFYTGLSLYHAKSQSMDSVIEPFQVHFRTLSEAAIRRYLEKETPFNCAGSFKSEGLGIALFESMEGNDPNALIGLPLIQLVQMLARQGVQIP